jgi:hypothetical protein
MFPRAPRRPVHAADRPDLLGGLSPVTCVLARVVALAGVAAVGSAVLTATATDGSGVQPAAAHVAASASEPGHRPAPRTTVQAEARPAVTEPSPATRPAGAAPASPRPSTGKAAAKPAAQRPWLPTGTGMWLYEWHRSNGGDASSIVARAQRVGLSTLYVRTGSSWDGLSGAGHLQRLLSATRGSSVNLVAWDFPRLRHPEKDARRLARAARIRGGANGPRVSAVAPDIETPSEGTFNAVWRVRHYLKTLNRLLPDGVTVLGTVPWPSSYRIADYPYRTGAANSDALVPMTYWYNNAPTMVTARSISYLRERFDKPVMPVGQGYDGKLDVPSLRHNHLAHEVPKFFRTAKKHGAQAVSLWSWQAAPKAVWRALDRAGRMFRH